MPFQGNAAAGFDYLVISFCGGLVPVPSIFKGVYLCGGAGAVLLLKEDVVILVAFERRVEINQVNRLIGDISPQDVEVVTVVKKIVRHGGYYKRIPESNKGNQKTQAKFGIPGTPY
jgi:hypothetical protein